MKKLTKLIVFSALLSLALQSCAKKGCFGPPPGDYQQEELIKVR